MTQVRIISNDMDITKKIKILIPELKTSLSRSGEIRTAAQIIVPNPAAALIIHTLVVSLICNVPPFLTVRNATAPRPLRATSAPNPGDWAICFAESALHATSAIIITIAAIIIQPTASLFPIEHASAGFFTSGCIIG